MAVKTITVTEEAYSALKELKGPNESFSKTILKIARRKPLNTFYGALGKESGARLERAVEGLRKKRSKTRANRLKRIVEELGFKWRY